MLCKYILLMVARVKFAEKLNPAASYRLQKALTLHRRKHGGPSRPGKKNNVTMKKIVAIIAFLSLVLSVGAQDENLRFGFQLSPTFSWMNANTRTINSSGTNVGLKMAMIGEFFFRENYAFTTGLGLAFNQGGTLQYERAGCYWPNSDLGLADDPVYGCPVLLPRRDTLSAPSGGAKLKYNIQYLEIPLGLKMRTREFGYIRYFLEPAITLAFNTQATGAAKGPNVGNDIEKINIRGDVNTFNVSWGIGAGLEYSLTETTALVGGLVFQMGFADVTEDGAPIVDDESGDLSRTEDSIGKVHNITLKLAVMF